GEILVSIRYVVLGNAGSLFMNNVSTANIMGRVWRMAPAAAIVIGVLCGAKSLTCDSFRQAENLPPGKAIRLEVDATRIGQRIVHSRMTIPVQPGPLTLHYPKWVPGAHGPNGPVTRVAGLRLSAPGTAISWKRDPLDLFAFHCEVPQGATTLDAELMYAIPPLPP